MPRVELLQAIYHSLKRIESNRLAASSPCSRAKDAEKIVEWRTDVKLFSQNYVLVGMGIAKDISNTKSSNLSKGETGDEMEWMKGRNRFDECQSKQTRKRLRLELEAGFSSKNKGSFIFNISQTFSEILQLNKEGQFLI